MIRSLRQRLCCADMLKDCATEQELIWMTEEVYEEEEAAQAAEDPDAVINVRELAHDTGRCDPVLTRSSILLMSCWQGVALFLIRNSFV